ncbi:MAG TPA: hypothetical protein VGQ62_07385 [Chloroflexota bacterium]|nr:hypothetical protein [Chloroflexota bacterium]
MQTEPGQLPSDHAARGGLAYDYPIWANKCFSRLSPEAIETRLFVPLHDVTTSNWKLARVHPMSYN